MTRDWRAKNTAWLRAKGVSRVYLQPHRGDGCEHATTHGDVVTCSMCLGVKPTRVPADFAQSRATQDAP